MKLFVGLDVSSFDIKVCFLNGEGDEINAFTVSNDLPGATYLRDEILKVTQNHPVYVLRLAWNRQVSIAFIRRCIYTMIGRFVPLVVKFL